MGFGSFLLLTSVSLIYGTVRERGSLEPIAYSVVEVVGSDRRVLTDPKGHFWIPDSPSGQFVLRASAPGYGAQTVTIDLHSGDEQLVEFRLEPEPFELPALVVRKLDRYPDPGTAGPGQIRIGSASIMTQPAVGEADVFRAVQALPSVAAASDFSTGLYVRGGTPSQNLILLDGVPILNPYHLGGVFAAFDPGAIASVEVTPGGFSAGQGDRLSSVVEVWTRDGGRDRVNGHGALGLVSSRLGLNGPLPGSEGSYFVSFRRTYLDLITGAAKDLGLIPAGFPYGFTDAHLKLTHHVGRTGQISWSGYLNNESYGGSGVLQLDRADFDWGTRLGAIRYRQRPSGSLSFQLMLGASEFNAAGSASEYDQGGFEQVVNGSGEMSDIVFAGEVDYRSGDHRITAGAQQDIYRFGYDISATDPEIAQFLPALEQVDRMDVTAAYLENTWSPTDELSLRLGARGVRSGASEWHLLPRFGLSASVTDQTRVHLAMSRSAQFVGSMRNEESVYSSLFAYDLLRPSPFGPATARDLLVGLEWADDTSNLRLDGFLKEMANLAMAPPPVDPLFAPVLAPHGLERGSGSAYGVEVLGRHSSDRLSVMAAYSLSWASRTVAGETYTPRYHRNQTLDLSLSLPVREKGLVTSRFVATSGQPYTPVVGMHFPAFPVEGEDQWATPYPALLLGDHNSARLPAYVRLDLSARTEVTQEWYGREVTFLPYVQVLNVLATPNVLWADPGVIGRTPTGDFAPQLPILPSFGLEWRF